MRWGWAMSDDFKVEKILGVTMITNRGETLSVEGWAAKIGLSETAIRSRLGKGETGDHLMRPRAQGKGGAVLGQAKRDNRAKPDPNSWLCKKWS